jgi:chemotaxis protein MotB
MSDEAPQKKEEGGGAPAWVMTFADLMSLLMCFFVLLLSFSEMDLLKFKQIAGSMKNAFGIQREIKTDEAPKGTSIIAREFTPGRPTPTLVKEIRQSTIDESKQTVEFTDAMTEGQKKESIDAAEDNDGSGQEAIQRHQKQEIVEETPEDKTLEVKNNTEQGQQEAEMQADSEGDNQEKVAESEAGEKIDDAEKLAELEKTMDEINKEKEEKEKKEKEQNEKTVTDAYKLLKTLEPEIAQGLVAIKTKGNRILLRINEHGSFPSGSSIVKGSFLPVLNKLRKSLNDIDGKIIVAGHTDNIPIKTARFRSNWELSSSRAVTVVHELLALDTLAPERFVIEGHGDAHPMVKNDSAKNRALNRRVELIIVQGDEGDEMNTITTDSTNPFKSTLENNKADLTSSVQEILNQEIEVPDQAEIDAVDLQTLKSRFEQIRAGLQE